MTEICSDVAMHPISIESPLKKLRKRTPTQLTYALNDGDRFLFTDGKLNKIGQVD